MQCNRSIAANAILNYSGIKENSFKIVKNCQKLGEIEKSLFFIKVLSDYGHPHQTYLYRKLEIHLINGSL